MKSLEFLSTVFKGWWGLLTLLSAFYMNAAQTKPDLTKPFKKCAVYQTGIKLEQINASDNDNNTVFFHTLNNNLISYNLETKLNNWIVQGGGTIEPDPHTDGNHLFYINSITVENSQKKFILNSLSLNTGITNWQKKLEVTSQINLLKIPHKELIFLKADQTFLIAINKSDGTIRWKKNYPEEINLITAQQNGTISITTKKSILHISAQNGEIKENIDLKNKGMKELLILKNQFIIGLSTGEIIKFDNKPKPKTIWKIKTGGSISNLIPLKEKLLVTSQDNFLYLFSMQNGKMHWKRRVGGRINTQPLIAGDMAIIVNENNNLAIIINLEDGKTANQIEIEGDNGFSGQPAILKNYLILPTFKGIFFFTNASETC